MTRLAVFHVLHRRLDPFRDPVTDKVVAFADVDLAAATASLLANGGYVATRIVPAPPDEPVQVVRSEQEALLLVRLLVAELRLRRDEAASVAPLN